jgi:PAS domain S-box-containing protein
MANPPNVLVLNVDDYEPGRYARTQVLQNAGFAVREAATGAEALSLIAAEGPDIVLLDINLPDINGFEVCRRLKTNPATARLPVLHLSSTFVTAGYRVIGLEGGADAYLTEPVEPPVLVATVNALLRMRHAEEAARTLARRWQGTFDALADGVATLSAAGMVLQCNPAFLSMFGKRGGEALGHDVRDLWIRTGVSRSELPFTRLLASRQREVADLRLDDRWFHVTADPMLDERGVLLGAVYVVTDVSDRKSAEEERGRLLSRETEARREAEAANRAKDEFLATLSHELRSPLNAMLGWCRMLRGKTLDEAGTERALETIERNVRLQTQLIDDLLDVSRIITGKLSLAVRPVDLPAVIEAALESVESAARAKGIRLEPMLHPAIPPILGDPGRLQQILWNLLSNAVKFTPSGGRVFVRLDRTASHARITVRDTGQGIHPSFLPYVFDRFRQAETSAARSHGGLGLGLAIVRHLVELHGGTVEAQSEGEGSGATFTVLLPFQPPMPDSRWAERHLVSVQGESLATLEGIAVLIVDDDGDTRALLRAMLERSGATVRTAGSARAALSAISSAKPDVLICDIGMPGEDGYELIRQVRELPGTHHGSIPAVALTAYARREDVGRAIEAGYQVHLSKPVDPQALARVVFTLAGRGEGTTGRPTP